MGGDWWDVVRVPPSSPALIDRSGAVTLATTDPGSMTVYVSDALSGRLLERVMVHEMGHCALWSLGLADSLHRMVYPFMWVEAEEWACNLLADYGEEVLDKSRAVLGDMALYEVPRRLEKIAYA